MTSTIPSGTATWWAPGRVNLIGDHTDYSDGLVLPFAIQRGTRVSVVRRDDTRIWVDSAQHPLEHLESRLDLTSSARSGTWADYVLGCVWALQESGLELPGVDVTVDGDVPPGAGLSSSASLTCATTLALLDLVGVELSPLRVAQIARRAEVEFVQAPVGLMDQLASLTATADHVSFIDTRSLDIEQVAFDPAASGRQLMVIESGVTHRVPEGAYADRVQSCIQAAAQLGVESLRDIDDPHDLDVLDDPLLHARARHVVTENLRVVQVVDLLTHGRLEAIGPVLLASHASLRDDYAVSTPELDLAVEVSVAGGADGARLTGAGFGGSVIALIADERAERLVASLTAAHLARDWPPPRCWKAKIGPGALAIGAGSLSISGRPDRRFGEGSC